MNKTIGIRKIATMQNKNVNDLALDAIEMYIGFHQKTIDDYDSFFGTGENELYEDGKCQFYCFLLEKQNDGSDLSLLAKLLLDNRHLPEMIWRFDQLTEFANEWFNPEDGELEQLWSEYEESIDE